MTTPTPKPTRRTFLAGAAVAAWSAPLLASKTVHAQAANCQKLVMDELGYAESINEALPAGCTTCDPGGTIHASTCKCSGWASAGVFSASAGTPVGSTSTDASDFPTSWTAPAGYTIVDASFLWIDTSISGAPCHCWRIGSGLGLTANKRTITFGAAPSSNAEGEMIRVLLCG